MDNNNFTVEPCLPSTSINSVMNTTTAQSNVQIPVCNYAVVFKPSSWTTEEQTKLFYCDIMTPD